MGGHQQRVIDERLELGAKMERLGAFLKSEKSQELPPGERPRLVKQLKIMDDYYAILSERIAEF